ncbi:transcription factor SPT20 homolog isoform X2 [Callorhinchus milii]|uniref:transcription factor SPT20 homolog isoform X2 n=1 Tax=Callorhinchus milii TaxID=7868 RepID=UPI0004573188|nr:transcription factor SPT20 homolog isoform X2 [Callorhinchus milii]|eukprot:gi/632948162/ref/XP_007889439.1/ PREDICTED: transcription factor SPT20 homolog isoform X9 [Callorhinchus milii]
MHHALEHALDRAEYIIGCARQRPPKRRHSSSGRKSVHQKLYDIYVEECEKEPELKKLRRNVNLLEKLVMQERVSCLVVNLYPGNEGYSMMLRGKNGSDSETIRLPYEEGELLEFLDAEELPPVLVDLLEKSQVNIFHCGCVIAEVRDFRQSSHLKAPTYQSRHILLRPTMQTLICDVHAITSDNHKWTQDDKLVLESQLVLHTAEPLCLDPSITVTCTTNRLLYNKQKMNTKPMKRCMKRYSRPALNRQQEITQFTAPSHFKLFDYLQKRKDRKPVPTTIDLKISRTGNCVDMWKQNPCQLSVPSEIDVEKYAKVEKPSKSDDLQAAVWPAHEANYEYVFEWEGADQVHASKLTVYQSSDDPLFYGKIHMTKDPIPEEENEPLVTQVPFPIGTKAEADRFVKQYIEVLQQDTKCPVKISHNSAGSVSHSQLSPGKEIEQSEGISGSIQSSVLGKGVKHRPPPIKLPSGSSNSSSGNVFSPLQSSIYLKSTTPPPSKSGSLSRKHSMDLNQGSMLSPPAMSPIGSSQRSGTPKPSTPTPTNTPSSTPHPSDVQTPTSTPSATPTPQESGLNPQSLLTPFAQQQMALSQALPVMTIPLSTMVTSMTTGSSSTQVMANPAGLNFINVVGSVCGAPTLMSGSNPMLGNNAGAITPTGLNLSSIIPPAGLVPSPLPAAMQSASQAGGSFVGLKNAPGFGPLNLLQLSNGPPVIFNSLQQQPVPQFSQQQSSQQPAASSPQQQGEQNTDQAPTSQEQALAAQQTAVINLAAAFVPPQAAVLSQLGSAVNRPGQSLPQQRLQLTSALQQQQQQALQQQQQIQQLRFLQQQMAMAAAAQAVQLRQQQHSGSQSKNKRKRGTPTPPKS